MEDQQSTAGDLTDGASRGREGRAADELGPEGDGASRGREGRAADELGPEGDGASRGREGRAADELGLSRRRHRMPVGKARREVRPEPGEAPAETPADDENDDAATDVAEVEATEGAEEPAVVFAQRRRAPRWAPAAVAAAAALFVGAGAFAGATVQPYLAERALVDTKLDIARTAAEAITTLWTYTPDNMETLADRSARFLGGDFEAQYRKYVDAIAPTNKQAQVSNSTQVVGAAVESVNGAEATAIVYTNSTATSPLSKDIPSLRYLSYRLTMERDASRWLVTSMNTVTSLDLTPQL